MGDKGGEGGGWKDGGGGWRGGMRHWPHESRP